MLRGIKRKITRTYKDNRERQKLLGIIENSKNVKLHLGCGTQYKSGWINIDSKGVELPGSHETIVDIEWNLVKTLPIHDESVDFIFHDDFFEHLTYNEGPQLLKDHYNSLKIGGVLRVNQPDLEKIIKGYIENVNPDEITIKGIPYWEHYKNASYLRNRGERINYAFRKFGEHKFLYDYESMKQRLIDAGFSENNIKRVKATISDYKELSGLEYPCDQSSLIIEAIKGG
jgi:predicted SAM-dependent methyltransferase